MQRQEIGLQLCIFDIFEKKFRLTPHPGANILCQKYPKIPTQGRKAPPVSQRKKIILPRPRVKISQKPYLQAFNDHRSPHYVLPPPLPPAGLTLTGALLTWFANYCSHSIRHAINCIQSTLVIADTFGMLFCVQNSESP